MTLVFGTTITSPVEVAGIAERLANVEELARLGADHAARQAGYRPSGRTLWLGWSLAVWVRDPDSGDLDPDLARSRRLDGRPTPVDVPPLEALAVAHFEVTCEVVGHPDPHQRLANAVVALAWRRAAEEEVPT